MTVLSSYLYTNSEATSFPNKDYYSVGDEKTQQNQLTESTLRISSVPNLSIHSITSTLSPLQNSSIDLTNELV